MKSRLVLVAFLMMLYIGPMILAPSFYHTAIPAEQNMRKDFLISSDWFDKDWPYRKSISINGSVGAGTNYQVRINVTYDDMQTDFDDIRFTDDDGTTLLDYWLESKLMDEWAVFWVEVKDDLDSDQEIYMYYSVGDVSTISDGEATFLLFDDFEDNNLDNWADTSNMQTTAARTHDGSSFSASWIASANGDLQDNVYNGLSGIRVSFWVNQDDTERGSFTYIYSEADYSEQVATLRGGYEVDTSPLYYRDTGVYVPYPDSADDLNDDEWDRIEFAVDFNNDTMQTWQNGVANGVLAIVEDDGSPLETQEVDGIGLMMQTAKQCWFDDVIVRKWVDVEPIVDIWGEQENAPPVIWNVAATAIIQFVVDVDESGINMFLIIFGLVLVPLSSMYLVKGGKSEMSTNKLFFGLIIFLMGWGLFLGGIFG